VGVRRTISLADMLAFVDAEDLCWVYVFLLFDRLDEAE
jgi:hypothetical protein